MNLSQNLGRKTWGVHISYAIVDQIPS